MPVKCERCGAEYENPASIICDNCGYKMQRTALKTPEEPVDEMVRCLACGHPNSPDKNFCRNCGNVLRGAKTI